MDDPLLESRSAEASNSAANAKEAELRVVELMHERLADTVRNVVREEMAPEKGRFIDVSRVPLICQSIVGIDEKLDQMVTQTEFWPVKALVYGFVALVLVAVVGALVTLVVVTK